ncbi:MAG: hypothetical protein KAT23_01065 [Anaerolineales bacterium]|nr:hypothetical protein [Anaerolineales bacterium]
MTKNVFNRAWRLLIRMEVVALLIIPITTLTVLRVKHCSSSVAALILFGIEWYKDNALTAAMRFTA